MEQKKKSKENDLFFKWTSQKLRWKRQNDKEIDDYAINNREINLTASKYHEKKEDNSLMC